MPANDIAPPGASQDAQTTLATAGVETAGALRRTEAAITAALKGPMSNLERALLVADRNDIRAALAKAEA